MAQTAREEIKQVLKDQGWQSLEVGNVLTGVWRRRKILLTFNKQDRVVNATVTHPLPFNAGVTKYDLQAPKRTEALRFIRGES